ncbi:helix-turn-helix domain-containing protein [Anabaena sp. FACHB-1237]|uniref:helix-turn-helix domain-containing protein n=1 Tax=Anabaena sp. FACHB-1237 TaxID=2692769 RepID=UPI0018F05852|nr:helix-turn-helix domain-containing protein [Anabaena sp. FACHB-1237]
MWVFAIPAQTNYVFFQNLYQLQNNYIGIVPPKIEFSVFQAPFSNRFHLYVNDNYLNQLCATLDLPEAKKFLNCHEVSLVICSPEKIHNLHKLCYQLYQIAFTLDRASISSDRKAFRLNFMKKILEEEIVKKFILTLEEAKDVKHKKNVVKRSSILKQAEDMMRNNLRYDLTIPEICQELGVSQRTLEYIFKDFYEISPHNYFKKLRLNALYQELQKDSEFRFIYDLAEDFGFFHRGEFAHDYYQLFGELPSKTLAKLSNS